MSQLETANLLDRAAWERRPEYEPGDDVLVYVFPFTHWLARVDKKFVEFVKSEDDPQGQPFGSNMNSSGGFARY